MLRVTEASFRFRHGRSRDPIAQDNSTRTVVQPLLVLAVLGAFAFGACAVQKSASAADASAAGCKIDAVKICEAIRSMPVVEGGLGLMADSRRREQNSAATAWEMADYDIPNGHTLEVQCYINTQRSTVVYANALSGPPLNESDLAFLREAGLCAQ